MNPTNLTSISRAKSLSSRLLALVACGTSFLFPSANAAPFTPGNLAVYRAGSGSGSLVSTGSPVFIDEYSPTGTLVQSIAMPTVVSGSNKRLIASGTATSEGMLTRSIDGRYLIATGYDAAIPTTSLTSTASATVNRVIGRVDSSGNIDTTTGLSDASTGNNGRSAVSVDGSAFWFAGAAGGIRYATLGASTSTQLSTTLVNNRQVNIFDNQLYSSDSSGSALRLASVGVGLPTTAGQTMINLPGFAITGSPYSFFFADLSPSVAGVDTLYVCDDAAGIQKFSFDGTTWTAKGTVGTGTDAYRGITGTVSGSTVTLYVTRKGGSAAVGGGEIASLVDSSGYSGSLTSVPTLLATAAANTAFRGIAFAPLSPTSITGAATATAFTTTYGTASTPQTFPITGSNLPASIIATAPVGFEVASDGATFGASASFAAAGGTLSIRLSATAPVSGSYNGLSIGLASGATTASITTAASGNTVSAKALIVTADNVTKNFNATLTGGAGSTAFTSSGLANSETIGSVTITYGSGAAAADPAGNYPGSVVASAATGGTFTATNYSLTYMAGNITVNSAITTVDLSRYVRVGRYDLPEPTRTTPPTGSLLCQEASNVTYNWDTDTLFLTGDGGTSVVQVTKTGELIDSMTLALNPARRAGTEFDDTEALAYIGNGEFVMTEERDRTLVKFTYVPNTTLQRSATKTMKLGTTIGNIGLEGVTWDPLTGGFILVKEKQPKGIFQTNIDWNTLTATNGSPTTANSTDLFNPDLLNTLDLSDIFALSNLPALTGTPEASHLLVISQESGQIINCDRNGNVYSRLTIVADPGSPLSVPAMTMEGVCMDRSGNLYVTNEDGGGDFDHPQLWVYALSTEANLPPTAVTLTSVVSSLPELPSVANDIRVADILVVDDGIGPNTLSVSGADAASFKIIGTALFLKAGSSLNATTKPTYTVNVNVDDATVGTSPDASTTYNLTVVTGAGATPNLVITEVAPWSSSNSGAALAADWFEVTNYGIAAVDLTGWTVDDNSNSYSVSLPVFGASSIDPGESVIFIETGIDSQAELDLKAAAFKTLWFGNNPPANLHFCGYSGSGVGLSTAGDAVNLFDIGGNLQAHVDFGANTGTAGKFYSFDNSTGLNNATISNRSVVGVSGAFVAANDPNEIGSPGTVGAGATPLVSIVAIDASASETGPDPGTFRISRTGSTASTLTAIYTIATGVGQATPPDYTPTLTGSVTFAVGQVFVDITITPVDDLLGEGPETLTLSITDTGSYDVGTPGTATITILDNDVLNMAATSIALTNTLATISEAANTASNIRVADITVTDDGQGTNTLGVSGTDAAFFTVVGNSLYLKSGTSLSNANKPSYSVTVTVDDVTVGTTPDASTTFTLAVAAAVVPGSIIISEVAPWSSTAGNSNGIGADWFEVTNIGTTTANITGWKMDDNSHAIASAVPMFGVTSIAPGEAVIFMEIATTNPADLATKAAAFRSTWFGSNPPASLQIGGYSGSGVGLSSAADEVVLFDASGAIVTGVGFGVSPATAPFATFDNKAGLGGRTLPLPIIATPSVIGMNGAFAAVGDAREIGSPGFVKPAVLTVAAGDVTSTSAVLWAHSLSNGPITLDYSTSATFAFGVTSTTLAITDTTLPVKSSITGLTAGTQYYYRAKNLNNNASGTFRTSAAAGALGGLHFGIGGDQRGDLAPYPSVKNAAGKNLDFFLLFGDNIYADVSSPDVPAAQARTLGDFRAKFNEVYVPRYGLNTLGDLRASTGVFAVIDDHEVTNNFSGGALRTSDARFSSDTGTYINQTETFANGVQAFSEYHPLLDQSYGATGDPITANHTKLYRYSTQGKTAATFVLDTRSFRSAPLTPVADITNQLEVGTFLATSFTPGRTLLGAQQKADFKADLLAAQAAGIVWKFVCVPEPIQNFGPLGAEDRYEGYAAERSELLKFIDDQHISNVVFVTADFHGTVINRLSYQLAPFGPQIQTNSIEVITGPIAYDKPFGPTIVDLAIAAGLAAPGTDAYYQSLSAPGKEALVMNNIINPSLASLGYNQIALATNPLPMCHLIGGLYTASNSYGWTEFTIDAVTQELNVKTWGIAPYNKAQLDADSASVTARTPAVVSEFALVLKPYFNLVASAGLTAQSHGATMDLVSASGASPAGGSFSGPGVTGGVFDPSAVASGVHSITYAYSDSFGSVQSSTFTITVLPSPLEAWRLANFGTSADTGDTANTGDFDHDGIVNLLEYALGLNPTVASGAAALPTALRGDANPLLSDRLAISFSLPSPNPTDVTYIVQASDDLATWTDVASKTGADDWQWLGGGASHVVTSGSGPVTVKIGDLVPADAGHPRRVMRLKVVIP